MKESNPELVYHILPMLIECTENFSISFMNFIDCIKNTKHISEWQTMLDKSMYFINKLEYLSYNIKAQSEPIDIKALEIQLTDIRNNLLELHTSASQFAIVISNDSKLEGFLEILLDELKYVEDITLELIKLLKA